jgi:hypothetical protein
LTRRFHKGDVVLVPFPFTDLSAAKLRPVVIRSPDPEGPDFVVAYVSSITPAGPLPLDSHGSPGVSCHGIEANLGCPAR